MQQFSNWTRPIAPSSRSRPTPRSTSCRRSRRGLVLPCGSSQRIGGVIFPARSTRSCRPSRRTPGPGPAWSAFISARAAGFLAVCRDRQSSTGNTGSSPSPTRRATPARHAASRRPAKSLTTASRWLRRMANPTPRRRPVSTIATAPAARRSISRCRAAGSSPRVRRPRRSPAVPRPGNCDDDALGYLSERRALRRGAFAYPLSRSMVAPHAASLSSIRSKPRSRW